MDWPIDHDWKCEVCDTFSGLTWGFSHGECRCNKCHAIYRMRVNQEIVTTPKHAYKWDTWVGVLRAGWQKFQKPIGEWTDEMYDEVERVTAWKQPTEEVP